MNNRPLQDQVALVTGAGRRIGRVIALTLARAGANVIVNYNESKESAQVTAQEIKAFGVRALAVRADVSRPKQVAAMFRAVEKRFGRLDILVNNAGGGWVNLAEDVTEEEFDKTIAWNAKSTFFACQAAERVMRRQMRGCIVNMSSQAGFAAMPTESVYCLNKAAITHLTKCLAVEWGKYNIRVNAVAPTFIFTPGTEEALSDPAFRADTVERIAGLHRIGEPREVAGSVVFLASSAASLITGHTLLIDGGWTAR